MKFRDEVDKITPPEYLKDRVRAKVGETAVNKLPASRRWRVTRLAALAAAVLVVLAFGIPYFTVFSPGGVATAFKSKMQLENYFRSFNTSNWWELNYKGDAAISDSESAAPGSSGAEHSTTNNQVQGVSESDIVHTDGKYIYSVSYYNLLVVKADTLQTVVNIEYDDFFPDSMFLLEDEGLLAVLGSEYGDFAYYNGKESIMPDIAYCYWGGNTTVVKLYNIKALTEGNTGPVKEWKYENSYSSSARVIDGNLYLLMNAYNNYISSNEIWIPTSYDSGTGKTSEIPISDIYALPNNDGSVSYMLYAGIDLGSGDTVFKSFVGSMRTLYASKNAFYAAYTGYFLGFKTYTGVNRFEIDGLDLVFSGYNKADGYIINQFAMDEYTYTGGALKGKTYFRIATTGQNNEGSYMTVFDTKMNQVGRLSGLGEENERIYSVRYDGERAVVVTYFQMDPLYIIDLSALKPRVISALKIEGVSDYLHFLSVREDTVFAVGRKQAKEGNWLNGIKVSVFDISGSGPARETAYFEVSADYSYSEATYNHKAIMYFKPSAGGSEIFAFSVDESFYDSQYYKCVSRLYYYTATSDGALRQDILDYKFEKENYNDLEYRYYRDGIRRSVIIGGHVYLIGYYGITRYDRNDFSIAPETVSFNLQLDRGA